MVFFSFVVLGPDRFDPSYFYLTALTGYPPQFSTLHLTPMSLYGIYHIISRNKDFLDKDNCQCQGQAALALLQIIITLLRYIGCIFTLLKLYASKKKYICNNHFAIFHVFLNEGTIARHFYREMLFLNESGNGVQHLLLLLRIFFTLWFQFSVATKKCIIWWFMAV